MKEVRSRKKWPYVAALLFVATLYCIYFFRFEIAYFNKTGIGPISEGYYVIVDEDPNTLLLPGNKKWTGKSRSQSETVIVSDDGVIPFSWKQAFRDHSVVVCFRPDRVYLCECSRFRRGYYLRMKVKSQERPNPDGTSNDSMTPTVQSKSLLRRSP